MKKIFIILTILIAFVIVVNAQPGCPQVNAGSDVTLSCTVNCATLSAEAIESGQTTSYEVNSIPYTPFSYTAGTSILVNQDDIWSGVINLPFDFCFYDNTYNQIIVGANGLISFDIIEAGDFCAWNLMPAATKQLPTNNVYTNTIMGPYHDIDPSIGGGITYQIIGEYPCRMFIVSYHNIPMYDGFNPFSTCLNIRATHQIVIYETTNVIEVYIQEKTACPDGGFFSSGWNDGLAILGIQNATGTQAVSVPGRNNTVWNATNEGWRWTPNGPSTISYAWYDQNGSFIGDTESILVCPSSETTYTVETTYIPCSGGVPIIVSDDVTVNVTGVTVSIDSFSNTSCHGANDAYASASFAGGVAPVNYGWQPSGSTDLVQTNLLPGTYIFSATDATGCTRSDTIVVVNPDEISVNVSDVLIQNCTGLAFAELTADVSGGTAPFEYEWNTVPVQNTQTVSGISPGTYTVAVTDAGGCVATGSGTLTVDVISDLEVQLVTQSNISCFGGSNGSLQVDGTNGLAPYIFTWNTNPAQTGSTLSNLTAGDYTVVIEDSDECIASETFTIIEPAALSLAYDSIKHEGCPGANDGFVLVSVLGGTPTYQIEWNSIPPQSGNQLTNASPGIYIVNVTDQNSCLITDTISINEGVPFTATINDVQDVSCFEGNDGTVTVSVTGGIGEFTFSWNNQTSQDNILQGFSAGSYNITVTESNGCDTILNVMVSEPDPINILIADTFFVNYGEEVLLENSINGNTENYTYQWQPESWLNCIDCQIPYASPQVNTIFSYNVIDEFGCQASASTLVIVEVNKVIYIPNIFSPNNDGVNDLFEIIAPNVKRYSLKIFDRWGELIYTSDNISEKWNGTHNGKDLPPSVFIYEAIFEFQDGVMEIRRGSLTLVR